ncbi:hypothetical protein [Francisella philomiragia]|uniref:hypothetical protein n=1 Tax=Francisella philomiragia TaxID=28110 RepID=UPI001B8C9A5E|nr:hypothetical protein [Francisella philomiragia]QUE32435.1 PbsX family transcriptional regulator [Francisella philomiragia]
MHDLNKDYDSLLETLKEIEASDNEVETISLEEMLLEITSDDLDEEIDFGRPVGREII